MLNTNTKECESGYVEDSIVNVRKKRINDLVEAHWNYIEDVLDFALSDDLEYSKSEVMKTIKFHYKSSGKHFYGHGYEDATKTTQK